MKPEDYELCRVGKARGTTHLTVDGKHTLCGRAAGCIVPLTIHTINQLIWRCGSCNGVAWSRERKRRALSKKGKPDEQKTG